MRERKKELEIVKNIIKDNIEYYGCGIFDTRNIAGDSMFTKFQGKYFTLDCCYDYAYYELFGTTDEEFEKIEEYYYKIRDKYRGD